MLLSVLVASAVGGTASASAATAVNAAVTAAPVTAVKASLPVKVTVNGKAVDFGVGLYVDHGKAYVEYGALFKALGYESEIDEASNAVRARTEDALVVLQGEQAFANGTLYPSAGETIEHNGSVVVGVRFAAKLTSFGVEWDAKTKTIALTYQGPTAEQKAAVYDVFNKLQLLEAAADSTGLVALISEDSKLDLEQVKKMWDTAKTKTVYEAKYLESYSDTAATVTLIEKTTKVSGGFYPDNRSETRYTLHKAKDGSWKIYNIEVTYVEYTNVPDLFKQTADIPDVEKAAIGGAFENQIKAFNAKDADAYIATLFNVADKAGLKASLTSLFQNGSLQATAGQWAVVEYDGSSKATLLAIVITESDIGGQKQKLRQTVLNEAVKTNGQWLLNAETTVLAEEEL
ncbi:stalk domain-containing protein [Cohnella soli]|uniref:Stalk domain-containing protein n=1 Tax=Cohnella soli TaxID=425005 RepID=A0ABW0I417_9BACL